MLVLTRFIGQEIILSGNIRVKVMDVQKDLSGAMKVSLGIEAPKEVKCDRREIWEQKYGKVEEAG